MIYLCSLLTPHTVRPCFCDDDAIISDKAQISTSSRLPGPTVGLAVSGGGYRAALVGAGTFNAFDQRNNSAVQAGTGGVLQLASYMTGLSGGSWFVSSLAVNNIPPIQDLVLGGNGYQGCVDIGLEQVLRLM